LDHRQFIFLLQDLDTEHVDVFITDFRLSRWLIIDVNSLLGLLQHAVVGNVAVVSVVHALSIFRADGGSTSLQNVGNIVHNRMVEQFKN
jgi:hypothetical protein